MVITNFKIQETVMFMKLENKYSDFYVKCSGFIHLNFFVLSKKVVLRQAHGIVCLMRACLSNFPC